MEDHESSENIRRHIEKGCQISIDFTLNNSQRIDVMPIL